MHCINHYSTSIYNQVHFIIAFNQLNSNQNAKHPLDPRHPRANQHQKDHLLKTFALPRLSDFDSAFPGHSTSQYWKIHFLLKRKTFHYQSECLYQVSYNRRRVHNSFSMLFRLLKHNSDFLYFKRLSRWRAMPQTQEQFWTFGCGRKVDSICASLGMQGYSREHSELWV